MTCKEAEAVRLFLEEHLSKVAVAETDLAGIRNRARDAEGLKALSDCRRRVSCLSAAGDRA